MFLEHTGMFPPVASQTPTKKPWLIGFPWQNPLCKTMAPSFAAKKKSKNLRISPQFGGTDFNNLQGWTTIDCQTTKTAVLQIGLQFGCRNSFLGLVKTSQKNEGYGFFPIFLEAKFTWRCEDRSFAKNLQAPKIHQDFISRWIWTHLGYAQEGPGYEKKKGSANLSLLGVRAKKLVNLNK